jgi:hypothetical protein
MPEKSDKSPELEGHTGVGAAGVGAALTPYAQAALTYVRRAFSFPWGWLVTMGYISMFIVSLEILHGGEQPHVAVGPIWFPLWAATGLYYLFALHVKDQFADSRARLTPGFCRVHATVAAAIALLLAVLLPLLFIWLAGLRSLGLVALTAFLFGAVLCSVALNSYLVSWFFFLILLTTFSVPAKIVLWQLLSGQLETYAVALLAFGVVLAIFSGIRLVRLNEDMSAYHRIMSAGWAGKSKSTGQAQFGLWMLPAAWRERLLENKMARLMNHARRASASRWSRVCRWQAGMPSGWSALLMGVFSIIAFCCWIMICTSGQLLQITNAVLPVAMYFLNLLMLAMYLGIFDRMRVPSMARELLLPVDRRNYLRQVGMAAAVGQFQFWAGISIGMALWARFIAPQAVSQTSLAGLLGVVTLLHPWFFGVGAWVMRNRTLGAQVTSLMLAWFVSMIPSSFCTPTDNLTRIALPLAGILAILGLLLTYGAYRRWLAADIDY